MDFIGSDGFSLASLRSAGIGLLALLALSSCNSDSASKSRQSSRAVVLNDITRCELESFRASVGYACNPSTLGSEARVTAAQFGSTNVPFVHPGFLYGVRLPTAEGDMFAGSVALVPAVSGSYMLYLGTPNVPVEVLGLAPACGRYLPEESLETLTGTDCQRKFLGAYRLELQAGQTYELRLGPLAPQNWVRVLLLSERGAASVREVSAGYSHTCAVLDSGAVKCWGSADHGELGLGNSVSRGFSLAHMGDNLRAVSLDTSGVLRVRAGQERTCALFAGGRVKCWGANAVGQLGLGDTEDRGDGGGEMGDALPALAFGSGRVATSLSLGDQHSCALLDDASVKCWGLNSFAQLGLPHRNPRGFRARQMGDVLTPLNLGERALTVAAGTHHGCAVLASGGVRCWGCSSRGQLGAGYSDSCPPGVLGAEAVPRVDLAGARAVSVAAGSQHTCALLDSGQVKCWGANRYGQLGVGDTRDRGDEPAELGAALPPVDLGAGLRATALALGADHSCALLSDGAIKCWGYNTHGQLGLGDGRDRGRGPNELGEALPAVNLGSGRTAIGISAGRHHTCALLDDRTVKCWGSNSRGQLGAGLTARECLGDQPGEMGDALPAVYLGAR
jgi:alpha-tubulin suppressor-like RCC1 family protein